MPKVRVRFKMPRFEVEQEPVVLLLECCILKWNPSEGRGGGWKISLYSSVNTYWQDNVATTYKEDEAKFLRQTFVHLSSILKKLFCRVGLCSVFWFIVVLGSCHCNGVKNSERHTQDSKTQKHQLQRTQMDVGVRTTAGHRTAWSNSIISEHWALFLTWYHPMFCLKMKEEIIATKINCPAKFNPAKTPRGR